MTDFINLDVIEGFLKALRSAGPWTLSAIVPDGNGEVSAATFTDITQAKAWVKSWIGKANIYLQRNPTSAVTRNASAEDLITVEFAHIGIDADAGANRLMTAKQREAHADRLRGRTEPGSPSFHTSSGNGVHALWRLPSCLCATPDTTADLGRINDRLLQNLGGDKGTWFPAQLMRLPGTVHLPDTRMMGFGARLAVVVEPSRTAMNCGVHG